MDTEATNALKKVTATLDELDQQRTHSVASIVEGLEKIRLMFVRREEASVRGTASTLEEQLAVFEAERQQAQSQEQQLKEEIEKLQEEVADRNALAEKLTDFEALQESFAQLQTLVAEKETDIQRLEEAIQAQQIMMNEKEEALRSREALIQEKDEGLEALQAEVEQGRTSLEEAERIGKELNEELELLRADHQDFMEEIVQLKEEQEKLQARLTEEEGEAARLNEQVVSMTAAHEEATNNLRTFDEKNKRIEELERALHAAAESSDKFEIQTKLLLDQLENYQQQREELGYLRSQLKKNEEALENERAMIVRLRAQIAISGRAAAPAGEKMPPFQSGPELFHSATEPGAGKELPITRVHQRKLFGEILCEAGVVTREQLEEALRFKASGFKRRIGSVFIELGYATAEVIAAALAAQLSLPFVDKLESRANTEAIRLVPAHIVKNHRCIPMHTKDGRLQLAMENPLDLIAIENVELATGLSVEPSVATSDEISAAIQRFYSA